MIKDYPGEILLEPLPVFPVIKDLVVDLEPFFRRYEAIRPYLMAKGPAPEQERRQSPEEQKIFETTIRCILCACCTASCPVNQSKETEDFIGRAALVRSFRYLFDSRDEGGAERMILLDKPEGAFGCQTKWFCTKVCPNEIPVTKKISQIKRRIYEMKQRKN